MKCCLVSTSLPGYSGSEDCIAMETLLQGYDEQDEDQVYRVCNSPLLKYMDNDVSSVDMWLQINVVCKCLLFSQQYVMVLSHLTCLPLLKWCDMILVWFLFFINYFKTLGSFVKVSVNINRPELKNTFATMPSGAIWGFSILSKDTVTCRLQGSWIETTDLPITSGWTLYHLSHGCPISSPILTSQGGGGKYSVCSVIYR